MRKIRVRNWSEFQHYKDRNPPWIKLHFALLSSEDWVMLDDASKLLAVVCMLVASKNDGFIPDNPSYLKRIAYLDKLPKLNPLIECGFLEILQAEDSKSKQKIAGARPETETETEKKEKELTTFVPKDGRKKDDFRSELEGFMHPDILNDLITHRAKKKAASTKTAARMFLKAAKECGLTPDQAAAIAIERNWMTVKPEWLKDRYGNNPQPKTIAGAAAQASEQRRRENEQFNFDPVEQQQGDAIGRDRPNEPNDRFALPKLPKW